MSTSFSFRIPYIVNRPPTVEEEDATNRYTLEALERHKQTGLELAFRARVIAMLVIAVLLPYLNPRLEVVYYLGLIALFILIGWLQRRMGRVGQSRVELALIFADLALLTFTMVVPNPLSNGEVTPPMSYQFGNFGYFFVILAAGTLAYTWRTVTAIGTWTMILWIGAALLARWFYVPDEALGEASAAIFADNPRAAEVFDPNSFQFNIRIQEVVVFMIVAFILSVSVRRFQTLLMESARLERERANLSRYFSPNVVDELSKNDDPLKQIRTQNVAVMFVDIVGFTEYASHRPPEAVIETLRGFHGRMETEVFRHGGTLDKYLGDGLMATFGTPVAGQTDASNAVACAHAMIETIEAWNVERAAGGHPPMRIGIGLHYGPAVLGDIGGANRLEFAVIGNTVNVASRLEAMTRPLGVPMVISDAMHEQVVAEGGDFPDAMTRHDGQAVRGIEEELTVWTPA